MTTIADTVNPLVGITPAQLGASPEHVFAVVTWGAAASMWAAKALNSHPEILCRHAGNLALQQVGADEPLDGADYLWTLVREGGAYRVVGDVHGMARWTVQGAREAFGENLSVAVLVREPMARLASELSHFDRVSPVEPFDLEYVHALVAEHELELPDDSYRTLLFVHGANMLNAIVEEHEEGRVFRAEDITGSAEGFRAFVDHLTAGKLEIADDWVDAVMRMPRVNKHGTRHGAFAPWQTDVLRRVVREEAWTLYESLGYTRHGLASDEAAEPQSDRSQLTDDALSDTGTPLTPQPPDEPLAPMVAPRLTMPLPSQPNDDDPHAFAIVSTGAAATTWVAKALNSHPQICCTHGVGLPLRALSPSIRLSGLEQMYFVLRMAHGYAAAGDVHGIHRKDIPALKEAMGDAFSAAVLVRDPLPRLKSVLSQFERFVDTNAYDAELTYIDSVIDQYQLDLPDTSNATKLFVVGVNVLNSVIDEQDVGPFYRMEDVTTRQASLRDLVRHISGGRVDPGWRWTRKTVALARVNPHQREALPELEGWRRDVVARVVRPEAWDIYKKIGYEPPAFVR